LVDDGREGEAKGSSGGRDSVQLAFTGTVLGGGQHLVEGGAVKIFPMKPDGLNLRGVVNVGERIGTE
jgi:hypothetical protein